MTKKQVAFTLLELLAVIVIVLILAGLLLPAIGRTREAAKRTKCVSNLRQIGLALAQYANLHGQIPMWAEEEDYHPQLAWDVESTNKIWDPAGSTGMGQLYAQLDGLLAVFYCPSEKLLANVILSEDTPQAELLGKAKRRTEALNNYTGAEDEGLFCSYVYRGRAAGGSWEFEDASRRALVMDYNVWWRTAAPPESGPASINHKLEVVNILYGNGTVLSLPGSQQLVFSYVIDLPVFFDRAYKWENREAVWTYADRQLGLAR